MRSLGIVFTVFVYAICMEPSANADSQEACHFYHWGKKYVSSRIDQTGHSVSTAIRYDTKKLTRVVVDPIEEKVETATVTPEGKVISITTNFSGKLLSSVEKSATPELELAIKEAISSVETITGALEESASAAIDRAGNAVGQAIQVSEKK